MAKIIGKLVQIVRTLRQHLESLSYFDRVKETIATLAAWEKMFYGLQQDAVKYLPRALAELDARLGKVLAETAPKEVHTISAGVEVNKAPAVLPPRQRVRDTPGKTFAAETAKVPIATSQPMSGARPVPASAPRPTPRPKAKAKEPPKDSPQPAPPHDPGPNTKKQAAVDAAVTADRARITQLSAEARNAGKNGDEALKAAKIEEARAILRPYLPKGPNDSWDEVVKRLDVSSPKDGAVFWSGDPKAAQRYAESIGGVTLETTAGGRIIDEWDEVNKAYNWARWTGPPPHGRTLWGEVSENYAEGVSGQIHGVTTTGKLRDAGTLWHNVEKLVIQDKIQALEVSKVSFHELTSSGKLIPLSKNDLKSLFQLQGTSPL